MAEAGQGGQAVPAVADAVDSKTQEALQAVAREGRSQNTARSYVGAARYWEAWHLARFDGKPLPFPVPASVVLKFLADHLLAPVGAKGEGGDQAELACQLPPEVDEALVASLSKGKLGPLTLGTVTHRLAVLSKTHRAAGMANPCTDPRVQGALSDFRRAYAARDVKPHKQAPLTREPFLALLATCDKSLRGVRDRALLLFAFSSGGRRRSEVTSATCEKLTRLPDGSYTYELRRSKTNQAGAARADMFKPVAGPAAEALEAWLRLSKVSSGAIFRRLRTGGLVAEPLTPAAVRDIVRKRAVLAGLEGEFSAHSLRSGFVTEAGTQNVSLADTMALTGHTDVATVLGYYQSQAGTKSRAANLLTNEPEPKA